MYSVVRSAAHENITILKGISISRRLPDRIHIRLYTQSSSYSTKYERGQGGTLISPSVIFSNHHMLLVNKTPGYHSQPNDSVPTPKCLLSNLKERKLGGGSQSNFLLPMHRIDQPCSGILILAKNGKAGTRITTAWKKGKVHKEYYCVVECSVVDEMIRRSTLLKKNETIHNEGNDDVTALQLDEFGEDMDPRKQRYSLTGAIRKQAERPGKRGRSGGQSVIVTPMPGSVEIKESDPDLGRVCSLEWRYLESLPDLRNAGSEKDSKHYLHLVAVKTNTGARHQVRAMLSAISKSPIVGDLRYGAKTGPLEDKSVALHARRLYLPTVKLGGTDLKTKPFVAPIPNTWKKYFGLTEQKLSKLER
jgi:23S rRNA-/tRNA-specific pseudouridylate synthase